MANMLGVTNPVPGQDNTNVNRNQAISTHDPKIQNAPDPSKVNRGDSKTEQQSAKDGEGMKKLQFGSNFGSFVSRLAQNRDLNETLLQVMMRFSSAGGEGAVEAKLAEMMEMLKMDEGELLKFMNDQMHTGNRFTGALFNTLREAFAGTNNPAIKEEILQFLKSYADFTSTDHIETNILRTMDKLTRTIPASYGNKLASMTGELDDAMQQGDRKTALKLLEGKIIPFLGDYTKKTRDMGLSRTLISVLTYNTARLEGGSEEALMKNFHQLSSHGALRSKLGGLTDEALMRLIRNSPFMQAENQNPFAELLIEATAEAVTGDSGSELESVFKQVLDTFLLNESVYVPLNHLTVPLDWDGKFLFSQIWADPDAEDNLKKGRNEEEPVAKVMIKMDVEGLGLFDLVVACQDDNAEMILNCPEAVAEHSKIVQKEMALILKNNGFNPRDIQVGKMEQPLKLTTVFPKIYEGENSVDVKA